MSWRDDMDNRDLSGYFADELRIHRPKEQPLTKRQLQIMKYLSHGFSSDMIAHELTLSPHTVHSHIEGARTRMGAKTRAHTIAKLFRSGYLT